MVGTTIRADVVPSVRVVRDASVLHVVEPEARRWNTTGCPATFPVTSVRNSLADTSTSELFGTRVLATDVDNRVRTTLRLTAGPATPETFTGATFNVVAAPAGNVVYVAARVDAGKLRTVPSDEVTWYPEMPEPAHSGAAQVSRAPVDVPVAVTDRAAVGTADRQL